MGGRIDLSIYSSETIEIDVAGKTYRGIRFTTGTREIRQEVHFEDLRQIDPKLHRARDVGRMRRMARVMLRDLVEQWQAQEARQSGHRTFKLRSRSTRGYERYVNTPRVAPQRDLHRQRAELASMRSRLGSMQQQLEEMRRLFGQFVQKEARAIAERSDAIRQSFERYAKEFLFEEFQMLWAPHRTRIGQEGEAIEFPSFQVDMGGPAFPSPVRRIGPDRVSESQREFIDLAFRMALMEVTGNNGTSTLVIDAPEASLDAVFAARPTDLLHRAPRTWAEVAEAMPEELPTPKMRLEQQYLDRN